jgi:hypothetical protein
VVADLTLHWTILQEWFRAARVRAADGRQEATRNRSRGHRPDIYRGFGFPGAEDLGNMFQYKADFEADYCGARDLRFSRSLHPQLQTFAQWLAANKERIPLG